MSITGSIAAVITLFATEGNFFAAAEAYTIGPGLGGDTLTVGSQWIDDDDS